MKIKITEELIRRLPKTDLHVHLDGSLRLESLLEMAQEQEVSLPAEDIEGLREIIVCDENTQSLEEYLRGFHIVNLVLQTKEGLFRAAYELAEDAAKENTRYMEVRYAPVLHSLKGLSDDEIVESVLEGLAEAEKNFGIKTGLIICGIRNMESEISLKMAELAVRYKNRGVVAFDLAGGEFQNPAIVHKEAYDLAKAHNLFVTTHAGEAEGAESIKQALHDCGAHRIGHGTRLFEDNDLLNYVNDLRIPLEVCLISNLHTKAVESLATHPFKGYLDKGLRVSLNTDNRVISETTLTKEYLTAAECFELDFAQIERIILNGFKSAFLPYNEKRELIQAATDEIKAIKQEFIQR